MVILHIAKIFNRPFCGVDVIVPKYIQHQQEIETIGVINVANVEIKDVKNQFSYEKNFQLSVLPGPFSKPDIIVFHGIYNFEFLVVAKQARKERIPYIIIPHGGLTKFAQNVRWLKKRVGNILFFNRFVKKAKAIQYLSIGEKDMSAKKLPFILSTNGIDIPDKKKNYFHENEIVFTYIGRYDTYVKGLDLLLEAINQKKDLLRKNKVKINLYGPHGKYSLIKIEELKNFIKQFDIFDIVTIHNAVVGKEKEEVLLNTDIYIQVSRTEGMPVGILEALSYGVPCLITEGTTLGENIKKYDAGWVAETNAQSIAEQFEKIIKEQASLKEKSVNTVKLIQDEFSWDIIVRNTFQQYKTFI